MIELSPFFLNSPFSFDKEKKDLLFTTVLSELTRYHYLHCQQYKRILDLFRFDVSARHTTEQFPFIPVRLFKEYELLSVAKENIVKILTSSGTTGQRVSKIYLDKITAANQTKALAKISADFIGPKRLPMLIIDSRSILKDRTSFSARGAGILGFSMLGHDVTYALDEQMRLDEDTVAAFIERHYDEKILLFGFTYIIWEHFIKPLAEKGKILDIKNGIMLHGGGWKKLVQLAVDNNGFKSAVESVSGIKKVHNYYGMVEQTGSIYIECEYGRLHCSNFSEIIIRNHADFSCCDKHVSGLIQVLSLLPSSYPGHSLLSEDIGELIGEDDCPCGRLGKTFVIHGRITDSEIRGCSDTYER